VSCSNSKLSGEIQDYRILSEGVQHEGSRYYYRIAIEATVKIGRMKRDLEFDAFIEGLKPGAYADGELLFFTIRPSKACYVHVFWIDAEGRGAQVYSNTAEPPELLHAGETLSFPRTQHYRTRKETREPTETISLIFVLTKKNIPFTGPCTPEHIRKWIMTIPSGTCKVKCSPVVISE
jgi:hypothetical protein